MKPPEERYTIKRLMIGIAVLAVLLAGRLWAVEWMSRPIPLPRDVEYETATLPTTAPAIADETIFEGTVTSVDIGNTGDPSRKWAVTLSVDKVVSGPSPGKSFWFAIHSPSQERVKVGQRYRIMAAKKGNGYEVISHD